MIYSHNQISLRKDLNRRIGSYNDRNDGFTRTLHSRSKLNYSRNTKEGKLVRVRLPHKTWEYSESE